MLLLLFDDSTKVSERLRLLSEYQPEHCRTMHEFAGFKPDLVLLDEAMTPEIAKELIDWGIAVCVMAERVTVNLRRRFPMVKDMATNANVLAYLADYFVSDEEELEEERTVEPISSATIVESAATTAPMSEKTDSRKSSFNRQNAMTPLDPSIVISTRQESRSVSNRGAKIVGFVPLRGNGGSAGKTGVLFNYAAYMAARGKKVIVVDLDPGGPLGELSGATQDLNTEHWCNLMRPFYHEKVCNHR